jgi:hypothetical protein
VTELAVAGALGEGQLGDEAQLHPGDIASGGRVDEG